MRHEPVVASAARTMVDSMTSSMALLDLEGTVRATNRAWDDSARQAGADPRRTGVGASYLEVCGSAAEAGDADASAVLEGLRRVLGRQDAEFTHDYPCPAPDGEPRWFQLHVVLTGDGAGAVVTHIDVTTRVLDQRASYDQARQDQLTGLANRLRVLEVLERELRTCSELAPLSLAFVDLDLFKHVNDSLGHDVGDLLLMEVAVRLLRAVPPGALLGRMGGDEFVAVLPRHGPTAAAAVAQALRAAIAEPVEVAGTYLTVTLSAGLATAQDPDHQPADLLRDADAALYAAKDGGRDRAHAFTPDLHSKAAQRLLLINGLRRALRHGELALHYQPVIDLRTGQVGGYEALMRWHSPTRGLQSAADFIPLAEESGLIVPMGRWLLAEATRQAAAWVAQGFAGKVGVNISADHLASRTLVDDVLEALEIADLPSRHLLVEITETAVATDTRSAVAQLRELRDHGVEVALDDFGAGYSSLGQLVTLPADVLKMDRTLLPRSDGSAHSRAQEAIARAVVAAGQALGMLVLAEGVETEAELATVHELGCSLAQGYLLGRPAPPDAVGPVAPRGP